MIKRPSKKDSENEILRMQQEFYAEQNRDANFQPAAKVVRMQRDGEGNKPGTGSSSGNVRQSEFAKRRAQRMQAVQPAAEPAERMEVEDATEEEQAEPSEVPPDSFVMGEIVERQPGDFFEKSDSLADGSFPRTMHITTYPAQAKTDGPKKSLFAQMVMKGKMDSESASQTTPDEAIEYEEPTSSSLLEGWDATEIHNENMRKLQQMSADEISRERDHLFSTLDPKLVDFIKSRKKQLPRGTDDATGRKPDASKTVPETNVLPAGMEVLREKGSEQWINFDVLEPEKLEWTKDIERSVRDLKPGESYEARFDWKGVLQPYVTEANAKKEDDRELYLHGEDAERPGYTLQELFRLARSNVLQQRISALGAIAGILNIMNQGFYDGILELPVSKVFFFLRFALDENTPSVVEVASRALASLFYNDTDEILLDTMFDTEYGMVQPQLALNITHGREDELKQRESELQAGFGALNLGGARAPSKVRFKSSLPEDDSDDVHNRETMNDFHLAETDLVECLLRTNILERIRYILFAMKPEGAAVINCAKILIRLARTSEPIALKIATNEPLVGGLVRGYLTSIDSSGDHQPQHVVLKLVRLLCAYRHTFYAQHIQRFHVDSLVKRYIFSRKDIDIKMIQIQIEAFRFFRLLLQCTPNDELYSELWPALCYLLEWHYQHLIFDETGSFIIRQHCVALLALIGPGLQPDAAAPAAGSSGGASGANLPSASNHHRQFCDKLFACFSKWFTAAQRGGANEFSQKLLLAACLWTAGRARSLAEGSYSEFLKRYLLPFIRGNRYGELIKPLSSTSLILTHFHDRSQYAIASLPTLGAVQLRRHQTVPTLVVTTSYPVFLLHALLGLLIQHQSAVEPPTAAVSIAELKDLLLRNAWHRQYFAELVAIGSNHRPQTGPTNEGGAVGALVCNWFAQTVELRYLLDVLQLMTLERKSVRPGVDVSEGDEMAAKTMALQLAFTVTFFISEAFYPALVKLFDEFLFVAGYYDARLCSELAVSGADLQRWKLNYKLLAQRAIKNEDNTNPKRSGLTVTEWRTPLLARSWSYSPLYLMVEKLEKGASQLEVLSEQAIIGTGLRFSELVEASGIIVACPTERLMYLLAAFMGPDSKFLEPDLSALIERRLATLRTLMRALPLSGKTARSFDFETVKLQGKKSFYGLYQLALDIFQSSSYGHAGFGSLLMAPLAQKYDVRWRNMVWSEYVAVLRFITCSEQELFDDVEGYLVPEESDAMLLRAYGQALNSNLLRSGSIPHRVANHHVQAFRSRAKVIHPQG
uniref:RNA polymerase II-associated protein 1 C-terminal domain-containing protein n=1 Tax=Anopheles atroparvus TaxID=41427 RepID=A0AAG5CPH3_ANOAO